MKKRMNCFIPQAVGACALLTAAATSHSMMSFDGGEFYIVPSVGYHITQKLDHYDKYEKRVNKHLAPGIPKLKIDFDDNVDFGIAFGFQTTPYTAIEFAYNYTKFDITGKGGPIVGKEQKDSTSFHYLHVDALYYFNDIYTNDFSFYIPVGLGFTKNDPKKPKGPNDLDLKTIEDTNLNFGIGAYYRFSEHFGIRGDVRGLYGFSQSNFDCLIQVGVAFRFGSTSEPANDETIQSASIRFKFNSTDIINKNDPDLAILAQSLRDHPNANIKILAYSSRSGTSEYNMKLSERRAEKLKSVLVQDYGVDASRIYTKAYGDEYGRSKDRRAVALVEY